MFKTLVLCLGVYAMCLTVILLSTVYLNRPTQRETSRRQSLSQATHSPSNRLGYHHESPSSRLGYQPEFKKEGHTILLTIFTSFKSDPLRRTIDRNTLRNWAALNPPASRLEDEKGPRRVVEDGAGERERFIDDRKQVIVQPILYTATEDDVNLNESMLAEKRRLYAIRHGWKVGLRSMSACFMEPWHCARDLDK